jgi:alanine dehydrogenase
VFSILIYMHHKTGFPLAICDGSYHTVIRTGAAAAVSAKWKARKDSKRLAIVGAPKHFSAVPTSHQYQPRSYH